jgi:nucleotide-binding universal stress UspA family protein
MTPLPQEANRVGTILVPLDASERSARVLPVAIALGRRLEARLLLLSAVAKEREVEKRSAHLRRIVPSGLHLEIDVLIDRDPAEAIDLVARDLGDALVCLASNGRGRSGALVGSVAAEVLHRRRESTVLVGPGYESDLIGRRIVACVDEDRSSLAMIPTALRWSAWLNEPLTLVTVAEPVPPPLTPGPLHRRFGPDDVDAFLAAVSGTWRAQGYDLETEAVYDPVSVASGVRSYLWTHPATLVAIGSHVPMGVERLLFGSETANIVRESRAPVLVVPERSPQEAHL